MPDVFTPPVRIHRVTTRRRTLRVLNCPLEPELLVAEFADELPPDVTIAVREHIAVCETCGARSQALRAPYEVLASLGQEPVPFVPDLRDTIRLHIRAGRLYRDVLRTVLMVGRGGAIGISSCIGVAVVVLLIVSGIVLGVNAHGVSRSHNAYAHVVAAGPSGTMLAQTDKLVTVTDDAGQPWKVAEVIAVDQHTGVVLHSLPASNQALSAAQASELPVAVQVSSDGSTVYEVTAPARGHGQALVAFDASSGRVEFITRLALPGAQTLPADQQADGLALSPDGGTAYIGLFTAYPAWGGQPRALALDAHSGVVERTLSPMVNASIPMPPPPGSLPVSVFPTTAPILDARPFTETLGAGGQLIVSPDGAWLFDVILLWSGHTPQYAIVRRINAFSGWTEQALALPGDFRLATLVISAGGTGTASAATTPTATASGASGAGQQVVPPVIPPQLYLMKGSPDAQCYVLDPGATGPTLEGDIGLGGPAAPGGVAFSGAVSASPAAHGAELFISQEASAQGGRFSGSDVWVVDTQGMAVLSHRSDISGADAVLANSADGSQTPAFVLSGGGIVLVDADLRGSAAQWLTLGDGHAVARLLASVP